MRSNPLRLEFARPARAWSQWLAVWVGGPDAAAPAASRGATASSAETVFF